MKGSKKENEYNVSVNPDAVVETKEKGVVSLKQAYEQNLLVRCEHGGCRKYVGIRGAYISRIGRVFTSKQDFNIWCDA